MQEKPVLEDSAGENDRKPVGIQCDALFCGHADKCCHKAQGKTVFVFMPLQSVLSVAIKRRARRCLSSCRFRASIRLRIIGRVSKTRMPSCS